VPAPDCGDDFVWVGSPEERLGFAIVLVEEAIDSGLKVCDRAEHAALQPPLGELGEEAFNGVEPRARGWREVESKAFVPVQPLAHFGMLVGGVIVEDHMHDLAGLDLGLDGVQEADKLLMPVALHVAADHRAVEHIERGEQRRGSVSFVVVSHGSSAPPFQRRTGLGSVQRLNLALLIDRQYDGVRWRIDVESDDIAELLDEVGVVGELELADAMRLKAVCAPNTLNRTHRDANGLGHHCAGPMRRLNGRVLESQSNDPFGHILAQRRNAGGARLVTKKAAEAFLHEALLPTPHAGFGLAGPAHDLVRADAIGGKQDDLGPPRMFLSGVAVFDERRQPLSISHRNRDGYSCAHHADTHLRPAPGIPKRTQPSDFIH